MTKKTEMGFGGIWIDIWMLLNVVAFTDSSNTGCMVFVRYPLMRGASKACILV